MVQKYPSCLARIADGRGLVTQIASGQLAAISLGFRIEMDDSIEHTVINRLMELEVSPCNDDRLVRGFLP